MNCSACGRSVPPTAATCPGCGTSVPTIEAGPPVPAASPTGTVPTWLTDQLTTGAWILLALVLVATATAVGAFLGLALLDVTVDSWSGGLRASSQKSGSVQVTTSGSFFGPSTSTQSISIYSGKVTIGSDGSVRLQD